ncbi:aldo/keto reductase [Actinocorallia sp. API 0066]|uniref:aldo/keto reductase n=1 Tax=Actinocorallia sp. API 0066 TaxID=2896846 RepID=UPI001E41DEF9|nr:aldo/keto reductase [Actinocorallia sp. API 0066]MCD0447985.1 aldo/keto reductase [Actinocorallia sp. API 0066]
MRYRKLGGTGVSVSEFALGAMMLGPWGNADEDAVVRIVHTALDAGINLVDTADVYSNGESERLVGKALKGRRDDVVLATKFFHPTGFDPNSGGGSRRWIVRAVEDSLRRLDTDHIDLYQMHRPDPGTEMEETLAALSDLVRSGKVGLIGHSTFPADLLVEARWAAERGGHVRFRTEQPPYSVLARRVEADLLPAAQRHGMGVLTWGPLSAGWLSGRHTMKGVQADGGRTVLEAHKYDQTNPANVRKLEAATQLHQLADDAGLRLPHLATAFVLAHPAVSSVILGPRTLDQLTDLLEGVDTILTDDVLDRIDQIVPPGTDLNPDDAYYTPPSIADPALRRRPHPPRTAH